MSVEILPAYVPTTKSFPAFKTLLPGFAIIWQQKEEEIIIRAGGTNKPPEPPKNFERRKERPERNNFDPTLYSLALVVEGFVTRKFLNYCASRYPKNDSLGKTATKSLGNIIFTTSLGMATFLLFSPNKHK